MPPEDAAAGNQEEDGNEQELDDALE